MDIIQLLREIFLHSMHLRVWRKIIFRISAFIFSISSLLFNQKISSISDSWAKVTRTTFYNDVSIHWRDKKLVSLK